MTFHGGNMYIFWNHTFPKWIKTRHMYLYLKGPVEKGHNWLFLTDLCFSWVKMDPACPSYHPWLTLSPRTLFQRKMLGLAARKTAKPPFFSNWHLKRPSRVPFSAILVRTSEETVSAIPPGLSYSFAWLLYADGPLGRARHWPLHSLHMAMYAIRAYLLPCNHCKACWEAKWIIRDRAPPLTQSKLL